MPSLHLSLFYIQSWGQFYTLNKSRDSKLTPTAWCVLCLIPHRVWSTYASGLDVINIHIIYLIILVKQFLQDAKEDFLKKWETPEKVSWNENFFEKSIGFFPYLQFDVILNSAHIYEEL